MQPKIYHPDRVINVAKPVQLDMRVHDGNVVIMAVNEQGKEVAHLITFLENEVIAMHHAKEALHSSGYDITFADWDDATGAIEVTT